jgi:serine/threonine-protein kinase
MSPEQALGETIDRRSDLFAMGIVLWETIAGQRLFGQENAAATLHRLINVPAPPLSMVAPDVDPQLEGIVARALARSPEERFRTALEMSEALEGWMQARGELARTQDVAAIVSELFADVRLDVKRQIQAYMAAVSVESSGSGRRPSQSGPIQWNPGRTGELPTIDIKVEVEGGSGSAVRHAPATPATVPPPATARAVSPKAAALITAIAIAAAIVAAIVLVPRLLRHDGSAETGTASAPEPPVAAVAASSAPPPAQSAAATTAPVTSSEPLAATTAAAPAAPPRAPSLPPPSPVRAPAAAPAPKGRAEPPAAVPAAAAATDPGFLNFDTYPWTRVSEGGRVLGDTPLVHVQMSPGVHALTLDNPEQSIHQTTAVTIKSGETVSRRLGLK